MWFKWKMRGNSVLIKVTLSMSNHSTGTVRELYVSFGPLAAGSLSVSRNLGHGLETLHLNN